MTPADHGHFAYAVIEQGVPGRAAGAARPQLESALKDAIGYGNAAAKKDNADTVDAIRRPAGSRSRC